jgi:site-specific recombinase XerD
MLDHLFEESVLERFHVGPLQPYLNTFAAELSKRGYSRYCMKHKIRLIAQFSQWLLQQQVGINELEEELIDDFVEYKGKQHVVRRGDLATLRLLLQHLQDKGVIPISTIIEDNPLYQIEQGFARYLSQERGLSQATLGNYIALVRQFLIERFKAKRFQLDKLCATDVTGFILRYAPTVKRSTARLMATSLRAFFRYLYLCGQITTNLGEFVPTVADWRLSNLPKSLDSEQIECLLKSCDQSNKVGQRDYTILLLLARLGLRAGEVVAMRLDDINWEAGELIVRGKGPRQNRLPIPCDVGKSLAVYLQYGRPFCSTRRVFIRIRAPHYGFSSSVAICNIVQRALQRANIQTNYKGAHLLRHTLATHMLRKSASLAEIGEILRHQLPTTTEIYTKVDIVSLRTLAQPWLGGAI